MLDADGNRVSVTLFERQDEDEDEEWVEEECDDVGEDE